MRPREIIAMGVPRGEPLDAAVAAVRTASRDWRMKKGAVREALKRVARDPYGNTNDEIFGGVATAMVALREARNSFRPRETPAPFRQWGSDLEVGAVTQMVNAVSLPVAVRGALMPDAHLGYGLPIGGVLAVEDAVIPYAVGMDIGCRMKMSVLDWPHAALETRRKDLKGALERETRFGVGASFEERREHRVMDEDWGVSGVTGRMKDKAWSQLGTSGSGNHFAEFGTLTLENPELGLKPGTYLALLSHSGARGVGAEVARHYSKLAMDLHQELPKELMHLAWLDLRSEAGREYWLAMELMGRYSAANHELIHDCVVRHMGARVLAGVENHHNFAWKERHFGRDLVVHRKGATPAGEGVTGIIPGSMAAPGYVVRGRGNVESLCSASHGAGRRMSRKAALDRYKWSDAKRVLDKQRVEVISAGLDEVPMAYKDIHTVMAAQEDLVLPIARFDPRLVKMAPPGNRPKD